MLLWDLMWQEWVPRFAEQPWVVTEAHVKRAFRLLELFHSVRSAFAKGSKPVCEAAPAIVDPGTSCPQGLDKNMPGAPVTEGTTTSELARRALCMAMPNPNMEETRVFKTVGVFGLYTKREKQCMGKLTVSTFRALAKMCPPALGSYDDREDALIIKAPTGRWSDVAEGALRNFANISVDALQCHWDTVQGVKGGAKKRARASQ